MNSHKSFSAIYKVIGILLLISLSINVQAKQKRFLYSSIRSGSFLVDIPDYSSNGPPIGIQLGYDYGGDWSLDWDFTRGDFEVKRQGLSEDVDLTMWGLYTTYRYPTQLYYMVRLGVVDKEIDAASNGTATLIDDVDLSYGVGGGFRFNDKYSIEIEFTRIDDDLDFVGLLFRRYFDITSSKY